MKPGVRATESGEARGGTLIVPCGLLDAKGWRISGCGEKFWAGQSRRTLCGVCDPLPFVFPITTPDGVIDEWSKVPPRLQVEPEEDDYGL